MNYYKQRFVNKDISNIEKMPIYSIVETEFNELKKNMNETLLVNFISHLDICYKELGVNKYELSVINKNIKNNIVENLKLNFSDFLSKFSKNYIISQTKIAENIYHEIKDEKEWEYKAIKKIKLYTTKFKKISEILTILKSNKYFNLNEINKNSIPLDKQIQAVAKELYRTYIEAGQFKYELKDKIKKMRSAGLSDEDIEDAQEMGDDQLAKLEMAVDELEMRMVAMAGDNAKLAQMAEVWAGEAKNMAAKKNQDFMEKRAKKLEDEADEKNKEKTSGEK